MTRATALEPGTELDGTYRIVERLGEGGMGAVYVAELVRLPKRVALKVLHVAADEAAKARFRREAEIAAKVHHPRIVEVLDYNFLEDGSPYLVMELLDGHDLRHRLSHGPMGMEEALPILADTASALERLHELGIVHRDLKPENIFLAREGDEVRAKVLDFGISKLMDAGTALTADRSVLGTPAYMAPEQVTGQNTALDPRTDQFALAAVAYEMITGRPAFQGDNVMQLFHRILSDPAPSVTGEQTRAPMDDVLAKAMSKDREERYPSVRAFVDALAETAGEGTPSRTPVDPQAPTAASGPVDAVAPTMDSGQLHATATRGHGRNTARMRWGVGAALTGGVMLIAALLLSDGDRGGTPSAATWAQEQEDGTGKAEDRARPAAAGRAEANRAEEDEAVTASEKASSGRSSEDATGGDPEQASHPGDASRPLAPASPRTADEKGSEPPPSAAPAREATQHRSTASPSDRPTDPEALRRLQEAQTHLAAGDSAAAIQWARKSLQKERSMAAQAVLAKAQCMRRDLGLAKAMARSLRGAPLREAKRFCREHGIAL